MDWVPGDPGTHFTGERLHDGWTIAAHYPRFLDGLSDLTPAAGTQTKGAAIEDGCIQGELCENCLDLGMMP